MNSAMNNSSGRYIVRWFPLENWSVMFSAAFVTRDEAMRFSEQKPRWSCVEIYDPHGEIITPDWRWDD